MWFGAAGGPLTKVAPHGTITDSRCTYNAEKGCFTFKYDAVESVEKFTPDCTVAALGAFNGQCSFTLTNVAVLTEAP